MTLTVNNAKWNKKQFQSNYTYKWTPGVPNVSPSIDTVTNTSLTVLDGATVNSTGTFGITYMNGHTTNSTNSYSSDAKLWFRINEGSWTTIKSGGIRFNTSWTSWSINKNIGTSTESASATFNFKINNTPTTMNNAHLNVSKNLSSTISNIQYSKDNATWQDSNIFSSLTPNTTYTLYVKAIATSSTGETATGYGSVSGTTSGNPPSYTATAGSITRAGFTVTPSNITYESGASFSSFKVEWGTTTAYSTGSNTNTTSAAAYSITGLSPYTTYYWRTTLADNKGHSTQKTGSITTTGNAPSYTASTSSITRTSFVVTPSSISYETGASFSSFKVEWGTSTAYSTGSNTNTTSAAAYTVSSLAANTTYYWRTTLTDNKGKSTQKTGSITTTGNAPSYTATAGSATRTGFTVTPSSISYDTNASFSSFKVEWGTSTSYGSSNTNTTSAAAYAITGLSPNITYYWRTTLTDTKSRSTQKTGSIKTTGNAPTYTATAGSATRTSFVVTPSGISYDTNASFSSFKVEWGTSTSYGSSNTNTTSAAAYTVSSLSANTLYYWRTTLTDNQGHSTQKTGSITTTGNAPSVTASTTPARTSCTLAIGATYDTNASFSSGKYEYGTTTSYGTSVNITAVGNQTISNLTPNTTYYYKVSITDNKSRTGTKTGSFKTTGNAPSITSVSTTAARTSCSFTINATYDTNASYSSTSIQYGTTSSYGTTVSGTSITGLSPNTTYYYSVTVTDNQGRTSSASTGTFLTTCNAPSNVTITRSSSTTTSITVTVSATGDTNAPITKYLVGYKLPSESVYTGVDIGTNTSTTISSLSTDTDYNFYVAATNAGGTTLSSIATYSTLLSSPTISAVSASSITANSCVITATASISPSRTLNYRFSKDGGSTWTSYQSSNSYTWTGLTESTTYSMYVQVKAIHTGTNASDTTASNSTSVTTLSGQAKLSVKVNGAWKNGPAYIKIGGTWKEAKKIFIKVNGAWKEQV